MGEYFQVDPSVVRLILVVLALTGGLGLWVYLILALLLPVDGGEEEKSEDKVENKLRVKSDTDKHESVGRRNMLGWGIVFLGVVALFNQIVPGFWRWDIFWPMILIIAGVYLILK